jgi:replicative DNA helicase
MRMAIGRQDILGILKAAEAVGEQASVRPSHYREQIRARIYGGTAALGYPFKWPGLQKLLRGLRKRELVYLTAHDKHGKTTTMTALAESFAEQGIPVAICCLEGSGPQGVADVQHQRRVGKPLSSLNSDAERKAAELQIDELDNVPMHIINLAGTQKFSTVADHARNAVKRHGCLILFMDHLHQISPDTDHGERNIEAHINKTAHAFADLAKELDIPIVLAGHPSASVEEDQVPTASSVKGGSAIKQVVDASISLWRPRRIGTKFKERQVTLKPVGGYEFKVEMASTNVVFLVTTVRHREATTGHFIMNFSRDSQAYSEIQTALTKPDGKPLDDEPQPRWSATMAPSHAEATHVED